MPERCFMNIYPYWEGHAEEDESREEEHAVERAAVGRLRQLHGDIG